MKTWPRASRAIEPSARRAGSPSSRRNDPVGACRRLAGVRRRGRGRLPDPLGLEPLVEPTTIAAILAGADDLASLCRERALSLVVVSNEVGEGVHPSTRDGQHFRDLLGLVNQRVAAAADSVTLMVAGIPAPVKSDHARPAPAPLEPRR